MTTSNNQITEKWLRTIGFSRSMQPANGRVLTRWKDKNYISIELRNGHAVTAISDGDVAEYLPAGLCPTTMDDVLKLCDAFGFIKPKPKSEAAQADKGHDMTTESGLRQLTDRIDILVESGDITPKAGVALRSLVEQLRRAEATKDIDEDESTYGDTRFCTNCKKKTGHACYDSGHERDSSYDWQRCLECGWTYRGITGKYIPY